MSIFIDRNTTLIVQGITGRDGSFHTKQMMEYGTRVVGGVTPGKGGQKFENAVPVFNTVYQAVEQTGANTSVIYVPPMFAADAIMEAADAGIKFIVALACVAARAAATESNTGIPSTVSPPLPGVTPPTTFVP